MMSKKTSTGFVKFMVERERGMAEFFFNVKLHVSKIKTYIFVYTNKKI